MSDLRRDINTISDREKDLETSEKLRQDFFRIGEWPRSGAASTVLSAATRTIMDVTVLQMAKYDAPIPQEMKKALEDARAAKQEVTFSLARWQAAQQTAEQLALTPASIKQGLEQQASSANPQRLRKQIELINTLEQVSGEQSRMLLRESIGAAKEVHKGRKVFLKDSPEASMLSEYTESRASAEMFHEKYRNSINSLREETKVLQELHERKLAASGSSTTLGLKGLARGTAGMGLYIGGLLGADLASRAVRGETISSADYRPAPLFEPNLVDSVSIGVLASNLPARIRIAGYVGAFAGGRLANYVEQPKTAAGLDKR